MQTTAMPSIVWIAVGALATASASAWASPPPTYECRWTTQAMTIDGRADEAEWQRAETIAGFMLPGMHQPARAATRARLMWDREYLYFVADMDDADLFADVREHDGKTWSNDVFELFFRPAEEKPGYYEFQVNAVGTRLDMFLPKPGATYEQCRDQGTFRWQTAVTHRGTLNDPNDQDEGWTVEGKIPWSDLLRTGGRPALDEVWRFALCRYDYTQKGDAPELSSCAALAEADFHRLGDYAQLKFCGLDAAAPQPAVVRQHAPLTTSRVVGSPDPPLPYTVRRAFPQLGLNYPIAIDRIPGSDQLLLIVQDQSYGPCLIVRIADQPEVNKFEKVLDVPGKGMAYGVCFHPRFAENGFFYVGWNGAFGDEPKKCYATRYTMDRETFEVDPNSALHIISWESNGHNGADLEFGTDGMLYVTSGDGTSDSDTNLRGQDLTQYTAKLLRIDVDHPEDGRAYRVPADNPFVGEAGVVPETWAYGFRNPWRIAVDPLKGHIWVGNNGQDLWEQIFFVRKGDNFGWSVYEGSHPFYLNRAMGPQPLALPAAEHHHSEARSMTGGVVYYGQQLPDLHGAYIYGDYSTGKIWGLKHDGNQVVWHRLLADTMLAITGFGIDSAGELLIADHRGNGEGAYYHLVAADTSAPAVPFPRKLSESGLFVDVARHQLQPGIIPYSVNSPLWSDGAHKERFIAIPQHAAEGFKIDLATTRGWEFPDETVLIKSFALETTAGDPTSRRWVETRFLTRQAGEWVGYTYLWNEEQTDAELVDAAGVDRQYEVRVPRSREFPDGLRKQTWHFPSRTECMVCHSRAANFVLGPSTAQMNKLHDYDGVVQHQFHVLDELKLLKVDYAADARRTLQDELRAEGLADNVIQQRLAEAQPQSDQRQPAATHLLAGSTAHYPRLVDPYDTREPLELRARSYLHANCASCHVEAGGGNAQMQLEYLTPRDKLGAIDVPPLHHKFDLENPRIIAPGQPERSVLLYRMSRRGEGTGQMPQLATHVVDREAVRLIEQWIGSLTAADAAP